MMVLGGEFRNYDLLLSEGKIIEIGESITAPGILVIDATDKWITPGIIDIHSHMGVYSAPGVSTSSDGNEATSPVTAEVWAEHSLVDSRSSICSRIKGRGNYFSRITRICKFIWWQRRNF